MNEQEVYKMLKAWAGLYSNVIILCVLVAIVATIPGVWVVVVALVALYCLRRMMTWAK